MTTPALKDMQSVEAVEFTTVAARELIRIEMGAKTARRSGRSLLLKAISPHDGYFEVRQNKHAIGDCNWIYVHGPLSLDDFECRSPIRAGDRAIIRVGLRVVYSLVSSGKQYVSEDMVTAVYRSRVLTNA